MCSTACLEKFVCLCNLVQAGHSGIPDALALIGQPEQQDGEQLHRESPTQWHCSLSHHRVVLMMAFVSSVDSSKPQMSEG